MSSQAFILPRASPSLSPSERQRPNHKTTTQLALGRLDPAYTLVRVIGALEALEKRWEGDRKGVVGGRTVGEFRDLMA
ncbi:hypothetical protein L202_08066 [Cryptococcus amylolentus CBS 6039]|uniref:Uncharacterized protein n=1 Tax=Cryptococcus amylolentus CBS 6039 TaxID=1295533 RepID=A0A1E3HCS4_9TREE|nr:hypothetical protein L202_08066 [Cryptococcus amylolentus CBS 6039]ODN73566.1 hypothetical protein L202_08066 [Cryptococcus amylolentus CBS 6039]